MITLEHEPNWKLEVNLQCLSDVMNDDDIFDFVYDKLEKIIIEVKNENFNILSN